MPVLVWISKTFELHNSYIIIIMSYYFFRSAAEIYLTGVLCQGLMQQQTNTSMLTGEVTFDYFYSLPS